METENPDIHTFLDLYDELFKLALYIRSLHSIEKLNKLYERFIELFNQVDQESRKLRIPDVDIQDANYAVAGFIDEIIGWESRLEQEFFGRNVAGEEFFNKLDKIKEEKRTEVLAVYYICLVLAFEGMYFRNPQKLQDYINEIHSLLAVDVKPKLAPHGERPQETISRRREIPSWISWLAVGVGVVGVIFIFIILKIRINSWAVVIADRIRAILG